MDRNRNDRMDVDGKPENTDRPLNMQPGSLEDIERAEAYATRTGQEDVTGSLPRRGNGADDLTAREGMASEPGGGAQGVTEGEDLGRGMRAKPADGLEGADGRIDRGEDIGSGVEAKPADGLEGADGRIDRDEDIGRGIRARRADEPSPGNPLV